MYGNIRSTEHVTLGSTSHFEGNIESESALVCGYVKGCIQTRTLLMVKTPATIIGDLISASVQLESGVILQGKIISNPKEAVRQSQETLSITPCTSSANSEKERLQESKSQ